MLQAHVPTCLSGVSSWRSPGHLKLKQSEIKLLIPLFFLNFLTLNKWHSLHPSAHARNFRAILHFSLVFILHLQQIEACHFCLLNVPWLCPLLPIFTATTFSQVNYNSLFLVQAASTSAFLLTRHTVARAIFIPPNLSPFLKNWSIM